ncbi:MAG: hypothetical protein AABX38_07120 [Candidatus Micrarchaeota archaeon]
MADDSKTMAAVAYVLTSLTGILVFFMKKDDAFARFHAVQSILLSVVMIVVSMLTFGIGGLILYVYGLFCAYKAYQGEKYMIPVIGKYAEQYAK